MTTYRNKHTNAIAEYLRTESVPNHPKPIQAHVLLRNGKEQRWDDDHFFANWVYVPDHEFARQNYGE